MKMMNSESIFHMIIAAIDSASGAFISCLFLIFLACLVKLLTIRYDGLTSDLIDTVTELKSYRLL